MVIGKMKERIVNGIIAIRTASPFDVVIALMGRFVCRVKKLTGRRERALTGFVAQVAEKVDNEIAVQRYGKTVVMTDKGTDNGFEISMWWAGYTKVLNITVWNKYYSQRSRIVRASHQLEQLVVEKIASGNFMGMSSFLRSQAKGQCLSVRCYLPEKRV